MEKFYVLLNTSELVREFLDRLQTETGAVWSDGTRPAEFIPPAIMPLRLMYRPESDPAGEGLYYCGGSCPHDDEGGHGHGVKVAPDEFVRRIQAVAPIVTVGKPDERFVDRLRVYRDGARDNWIFARGETVQFIGIFSECLERAARAVQSPMTGERWFPPGESVRMTLDVEPFAETFTRRDYSKKPAGFVVQERLPPGDVAGRILRDGPAIKDIKTEWSIDLADRCVDDAAISGRCPKMEAIS